MQKSLIKSEIQEELSSAQAMTLGDLIESVSGVNEAGRDAHFHRETGVSKFRISREKGEEIHVLSSGEIVVIKKTVIGKLKGGKK